MTCDYHEGPCLCDPHDADAVEITRQLIRDGQLETTKSPDGTVAVRLARRPPPRSLF